MRKIGMLAKGNFAKRVRAFANRRAGLQVAPNIFLGSAAAAVIATLAGAFGTGTLPLGQRALFWIILMGWMGLKFTALFAWRITSPQDWWKTALVGSIVCAVMLPLEIVLVFEIVGHSASVDAKPVWIAAAIISALILLIVFTVMNRPTGHTPEVTNQLERAGIPANLVACAVSEDHYCRLRMFDKTETLIHARIADISLELAQAQANGARIHRSHWVADRAVKAARREGRHWLLVLSHGGELRVSDTYRNEAKRRGWLSRRETVKPHPDLG